MSIGITCGAMGAASLLVVIVLVRYAGRALSLLDAVSVLGVLLAVVGLGVLGGVVLFSAPPRPLRRGELSRILRVVAWVSVIAGIVGASQALWAAPRGRGIEGIVIDGVFEFLVRAAFFTIPGITLGFMRLFAQGDDVTRRRRRTRGKNGESDLAAGGAPFVVEMFGRFEADSVVQRYRDEPGVYSPEIQAQIARTWEAECAVAEADGIELYNGRLAQLISAQVAEAGLILTLGPTCYRDFVGTNMRRAAQTTTVGLDARADPLGVSAVVVTQDGRLSLGRRSARVACHAGYLHPFGGMVEEADRSKHGFDVFHAIVRELEEELDISRQTIATIAVIALIRDVSLMQPELVFEVNVRCTREQLQARFDAAPGKNEHTGLEFVADEPEAIVPFLDNSTPVSPIAQGALLLYGRQQWGRDWYERACFMSYGNTPRQFTRDRSTRAEQAEARESH